MHADQTAVARIREAGGEASAPAQGLSPLAWKLNRLRCMSPAEIGHRTVRAMLAQVERVAGLRGREVPRAELRTEPRAWIRPSPRVIARRYYAAAERIASGRLDVFALRDAELGTPPRWNRDPKTGIEAPLEFGKLLDYRDERVVGDIKYLWEPNRHLQLVTLAQAYALSGERRWLEALRTQIDSWLDACPYGQGANWASALEPAMRLINWAAAWQLIGGARSSMFAGEHGARFRDRWLESVYQHAEFIRGHFSLYSSANNHLLGEAAGLFVAALAWPHWPRAGAWREEAAQVLETHGLAQNAADGVNLEQAVSYQQFTFDLLLLPMLAARANGRRFSAALEKRLEAMLEYIASIMDVEGNLPMFGDSDDAFVVKLSQEPGFCRFRSLLATGAVLFNRADFKAKAGALDDKTRWLLGEEGEAAYEALDPSGARLPIRRAFSEGGMYVLGCGFETAEEIRLVADCGPLGYTSIAAHGHADALSFTLSVGGLEFLVDPGTYAYHTQGDWRAYFRGTSAHNTLRIDGTDQSQPGGNFMWLRKARAACSLWSSAWDRDTLEGCHDGYTRLADPVTHHRRITLEKVDRRVVLEDRLEMAGSHRVELFFHCSERCSVVPVEGGFQVVQGKRCLTLRLPQGVRGSRAVLYRGSSKPVAGWVSRRYDEKLPAWTIAWRAQLAGDAVLRTEIQC